MAAPLWKHWNSDLSENSRWNEQVMNQQLQQEKGLGQGSSQFNK